MIRPQLGQAFTRLTFIRSGWHRYAVRHQYTDAVSNHLPRIAQPSLWESIFPKGLRNRARDAVRSPQKQPTNPASYFIWIYILIGSQAIRILSVQNDFNAYMRKADLRIGKLREVVERLQRGEDIDVEKILGTGDEEQEQEWEDALREIEKEDRVWQDGKRKRQEEQEKLEAEKQDASPVSRGEVKSEVLPDLPATLPRAPPSQPGFY